MLDITVTRLFGQEMLLSPEIDLANPTVMDFWQWAFSDICANSTRGIFAEWLVAKLLGIQPALRDPWAGWDLETPGGVKIEVKTGAYLQSWSQKSHSKIKFSGLSGRLLNPDSSYAKVATYNADLYVFCVQIEKDSSKWNALDLDQWRFYIVRKEAIEQRGCNSLSLSVVASLCNELDALEFQKKAAEMLNDYRKMV